MSAKFEESQQQVLELSASEEDRVQELHKLSQDRNRAWEFELEAVQKQHAMDAAALAYAVQKQHAMDAAALAFAVQKQHAIEHGRLNLKLFKLIH